MANIVSVSFVAVMANNGESTCLKNRTFRHSFFLSPGSYVKDVANQARTKAICVRHRNNHPGCSRPTQWWRRGMKLWAIAVGGWKDVGCDFLGRILFVRMFCGQ